MNLLLAVWFALAAAEIAAEVAAEAQSTWGEIMRYFTVEWKLELGDTQVLWRHTSIMATDLLQ